MFTILGDEALSTALEDSLDKSNINQFVVDLKIDEDRDSMLDDTCWAQKLVKIKALLATGVNAACLILPGVTFDDEHRSKEEPYGLRHLPHESKKAVRIETCPALRILQLLAALTSFCVPWL